jgi:hypothetical protein
MAGRRLAIGTAALARGGFHGVDRPSIRGTDVTAIDQADAHEHPRADVSLSIYQLLFGRATRAVAWMRHN